MEEGGSVIGLLLLGLEWLLGTLGPGCAAIRNGHVTCVLSQRQPIYLWFEGDAHSGHMESSPYHQLTLEMDGKTSHMACKMM